MKGALRKIIVIWVLCGTLALAASSLSAAQEEGGADLVSGLNISLVNAPDSATVGETFSMTVIVTNNSGASVTGRLRTYLYAKTDQVSYPLPEEGFEYVPLTAGEWVPNEIQVTLSAGQTSAPYQFSLTVSPSVLITNGSSALAKLRARFRKTGSNTKIAPDSDKEFTVFTAITITEIPFVAKVSVTVIFTIVLIVAAIVIALRKPSFELPTPA